jgi:hypothetical protein
MGAEIIELLAKDKNHFSLGEKEGVYKSSTE